jgi:hypothetical protein
MRLLVILMFLLTPLQPVAALALCLGVEHGAAMPCYPGTGEMSEPDEDSQLAVVPAPAGTAHFATISLTDSRDGTAACGAVGLCSAPVPGVAPAIARGLPERPADIGPISFLPHLGPGTRPAPPLQPPRA